MFWLALLSVTALLWLASEDRQARRLLALMIAGVLAMQVGKILPLGDTIWAFSAFIWFVVASLAYDAKSRQSDTFAALMLVSVMCYTVGGLGGAEFARMAPLIVIDETVAWVAVFKVGGPGLVNRISRYFTRLRSSWNWSGARARVGLDSVRRVGKGVAGLKAMDARKDGL